VTILPLLVKLPTPEDFAGPEVDYTIGVRRIAREVAKQEAETKALVAELLKGPRSMDDLPDVDVTFNLDDILNPR
jgi:hypothetical protein